ncbi:hypothetical protein JL720_5200 [Aureococcus anophagefferens]|nr:hypothetical protein JL720_5200 [Aureococcus anophagefferens]
MVAAAAAARPSCRSTTTCGWRSTRSTRPGGGIGTSAPLFEDPATLRDVGARLRAGDVVVLKDAFRDEFAQAVHAELAADTRTVAYVWHLSKGWRPEWGGALYWAGADHAVATHPASFNTLVLFCVTTTSAHFVTTVSPHHEGKRLTFNGWWQSAWLPSEADAELDAVLADEARGDKVTHAQLQAIADVLADPWQNIDAARRERLDGQREALMRRLFPRGWRRARASRQRRPAGVARRRGAGPARPGVIVFVLDVRARATMPRGRRRGRRREKDATTTTHSPDSTGSPACVTRPPKSIASPAAGRRDTVGGSARWPRESWLQKPVPPPAKDSDTGMSTPQQPELGSPSRRAAAREHAVAMIEHSSSVATSESRNTAAPEIFRFSEMDREIARLQAEVARLREAACRPYLRDVLAFCETVASERLDGFLVRDLAITDDHARHADMRRMTYADKVSIVPELTKRGYHVTQFPEDHSGGAPMMIDFDAPAPAAVEGLVLHRPDAPRFEVGAVVEAFVEPGASCSARGTSPTTRTSRTGSSTRRRTTTI